MVDTAGRPVAKGDLRAKNDYVKITFSHVHFGET